MTAQSIRFENFQTHYGKGSRMVRVQTLSPKSVLYVNEFALRRDFSFLGDVLDCREFVARVGSILSEPNFDAPDVNLPPDRGCVEATCLRPPRYGRAGVVDAREILGICGNGGQALVDVKGIGVAPGNTPLPCNRRTGLLTVLDAIQELINQVLLDGIFEREGVDVACNEIYGITFAGIYGYSQYFRDFVPCVSLLRRAHLRNADNNELSPFGSEENAAKVRIERLLRRYGVTSAPAQCALRVWEENGMLKATLDGNDLTGHIPEKLLRYHFEVVGLEIPQTIRFVNIQTAGPISAEPLSARLIDLGHYTVLSSFGDHHLVTVVSDRPLNWGQLFRNDGPDWVEPDPGCVVNAEALGKGSFADNVLDQLPLSSLMRQSQRNGTIPGSMRQAGHLTAAWLSSALPAEEISLAAIDFARATLPS